MRKSGEGQGRSSMQGMERVLRGRGVEDSSGRDRKRDCERDWTN